MNELLGLFGYDDKINSTDTANLNLENYSKAKKAVTNIIRNCHIKKTSTTAKRMKSELIRQNHEPSTSSDRGSLLEQCAWCREPGSKQIDVETAKGTKFFCSEICFTQCRRASFKKNKSCDLCKNTQHALNVLTFQDGDTVLQFCSEKCLNQYKMSVFCKETQENLQKLMASGDDSLGKKENRKFLITPELWACGEQARRAAEERYLARDKDIREPKEHRERCRKAQALNIDKGGNLKPLSPKFTTESIVNTLEHVKREHNVNINVEMNAKVSEHTNHVGSLSDTNMSTSSNFATIPPEMTQSAMAAICPWLQQAQYMGSVSPGVLPCGLLTPLSLAELFPQLYVESAAKTQSVMHDRESETVVNKPLKDDIQSISDHVLGKSFEHPNNVPQVSDTKPSPADRRTSILFPVDFPQFFANKETQNSRNKPSTVGSSVIQTGITAVPPVTMMVPFPVILPLPVPVPIPIPLTVQQLKNLFGYTCEKNCNPTKTTMPHKGQHKESNSPLLHFDQNHISETPSSIDCYNDTSQIRSDSRNSSPDLAQSSGISYINYNERESRSKGHFCCKRPKMPEMIKSLDLSRSSKYARCDFSTLTSDSNDGAIDLSANRESGHASKGNISEKGVMKGQMAADNNSSRNNNDTCSDDVAVVPKIHIITHKDETPLNQPLPLPPTEYPYSSRRGLILDAPAIHKNSKSPSPERRTYIRNVPRDIIEAAKRRCMRAAIRTKRIKS